MPNINPRHVVEAPWTPTQFVNIIRWQTTDWVHPLTCSESEHGALVVSTEGLECPKCDYRQTWVPRLIAQHGPPPDPREELFKVNLAVPYESEPLLAKLISVLELLKPDLEWLLEDVARLRSRIGWAAVLGIYLDYVDEFGRLDSLEAAVRDLLEHLPDAAQALTELQEIERDD